MKAIVHHIFGTALLLMALGFSQKAFANAAQPGIWNAGGTVFTMLYPQDSLTFKKVQMQQERIYIQLYKGYAVVKGTYLFRNTTGEPLRFKMGYPVNGIYYGGEVDGNEVTLDSLSRFKISAKDEWLPLLKEAHPELNNDNKSSIPSSDNWMVWEMAFAPNESQSVAVYFIVNTNNAGVRSGYNYERKNAFIYLLESGNVWHQPIQKGNFYVQLMEGLTPKDVQGLSSGFGFRYNETHQLYSGTKTNFSPTRKDNLVATYYERNETFSFEKIITQSDSLFAKVDELSNLLLETLMYTEVKIGDPYAVETTFWGVFPALLTLFVLSAPFIIGVIAVVIIVWATVKWNKIRRRKYKGV
ncbi:hypothetical protein [Parapedobacter indicus]|uniref:Uncharacterized protein n=1 Tax=Parapedobacter indicus TaxID=1477437 RepID=A0A1I3NKN1_9SPHI|nr:hypothetical protein [Parapedobacter indicus]PPL01017.1 hypothetical protein CLV26_107238 [Parapedobacter indicus]SFJ09894.1 hypothetical protein SAMN05444682_107238 [Parapedobacter indicus]